MQVSFHSTNSNAILHNVHHIHSLLIPPLSPPSLNAIQLVEPFQKSPSSQRNPGHLFEKRLIEKIIQETGRCPVTNEPLEPEDLIPSSSQQGYKTPTYSSDINPRPFTLFQNEWDSTVLELYQLRQSLHTTRQELSHALYQHDAATRVVARLLREKEAIRQQLEAAAAGGGGNGATTGGGGKRGRRKSLLSMFLVTKNHAENQLLLLLLLLQKEVYHHMSWQK